MAGRVWTPDAPTKAAPQWHTRQAEEADCYPLPVNAERIALEDCTLLAGLPAEIVIECNKSGYAPDLLVAEAVMGYRARKHAPYLMESEPLPDE